MAHPLERKISQVRRQARRLLALYALGWTVAALAATVAVLGLADYCIRFHDHGIRLMCSLSVLLVAAWTVYRFWFLAFRRRLGDVAIAKRIERFFPTLADRLASTVQFLKQSEADPEYGSVALRRAVILETASDVEELDFSQVFERRPTRRALAAAAVVAAVVAAIALLAPQNTAIALARLVRPLGSDAWPRAYSVRFRDPPTRLAVGETFEVELLDDEAHRLPDEVRIHYRYEAVSAPDEADVDQMHLLNGVVVAHKENVSRPFWYRAEGGDDQSMDWIRLEVVEPPRLDTLKITLHPPTYSGLPVEPSEKSIQALRGTRVELSGTSTKKLRGVRIHQEGAEEITAALSADAYGFSLLADAAEPFVVDKSGPYWIVLEDNEGLAGGAGDRWDIRAVTDLAPTLTIEQPAANVFVTPAGAVPLRIVAKDDLAIRAVDLHFSRSDNSDVEDLTIPLFAGPERVPPTDAGGQLAGGRLGESRTLEHRWSLAELNLKSGTQITCWATAGDYLPQTGKSTVRRLTIISPQELEERLAQRQMLIFAELERVLKLEQDARAQTKSLEIQIDRVGHLEKQDIDHVQAAELNQRQVARTLTSTTEGIPAQIADFLADLESNRVDSPDLERRMTAMAEELDRLGEQPLRNIERELTGVIKAAQAALPRDAAGQPADPLVGKSLTAAGKNQDQVIASLESMLDELRQWDNYRRFARDVAQLQRAQQEIAEATREVARQTLGRDAKDLDAQQQADLKKLASQQAELSRRLEKTQQQMDQMNRALESTDPLSAAAISDGLHHAERQAISGQMRQTSDRIENNQLAQAAQQQAKIAKDLDDLQAILSNRREQELSRLVKQLREAEREIAGIRARQAGLRKQMQDLADKPATEEQKQQLQRLAREQRQLQEDAARMARRLERLQAEQAGRSAAGAVGKMGEAGSASQQGHAADAQQQAGGAEKDLEEAQEQVAQRRRQAEEDLAREQMAKLEDALKGLHARQEKLIAETERLEKLRVAEGRFTRAQASTVHDLARQQKALRTETSLLAEKLSLTEVINLALDGAARQMVRASELLERQRTGSQTQTAQDAARQRFAQLLTALENKSKSKEGKEGKEGGGGSGGGKSQGRPDGDQVLTQLKLLKLLQEDLNSRYRNAATPQADSTDAAEELADIATEQKKLAELAGNLAQPPEANPEDNPDSLPDVRQDGLPPDAVPRAVPPPDDLLEPASKERSP